MKKLAIIGASYLQLPLVQKAKEMGVETHCFAWEEGAVCKEYADYFYAISVTSKEDILKKCRSIGIDGVTSIASDIAVPTVSYIAQKLNLISNSIKSSEACTNKYLMRRRLRSSKIKCPQFLLSADIIHEGVESLDFPVIVKPVDRSGSRGVSKINSKNCLTEAISRAKEQSLSGKVIIEEYIKGEEVSVETISWKGKHYIMAVTDKITTGSPHFVELAHHQPSMLSQNLQNHIKKETIKALDALEIKYGASHSEFIVTEDGKLFVVEVGARMGGDFIGSHLVQLSTGFDFLAATLAIALGDFKKPILNKKSYSGVYFLSGETKHLLPYFNKHNDFDVIKEVQDKNLKFIQNSSDRSGYLVYQADKKINLL